jgi:hypothetical protein
MIGSKEIGRPKKIIREIIRIDLDVNELNPNMIYDQTT